MEKLKLHSVDLTAQNIEKLATLFPNCVTEAVNGEGEIARQIDFDLLKQELSQHIVDGPQERYRLDWPGKREALLAANAPIAKTLRPARDESVDFDHTQNLFIEGDNLDALKLLQETYLNQVKMIYIDPPYNTGNDFIYKDDFSVDTKTYLDKSNQVNESGERLVANKETNGRYHSDWLSMMYPRLKLARNLLRDDGLIFISIDDNEQHNLRKMCDEIFGEENFEGHIHWRRRNNQPNDTTKMIGLVAEHIISYSKNKDFFKQSGVGKVELTGNFSNPDNDSRGDWASKPWKVGSDQSGSFYKITLPNGIVVEEEWMGSESSYLDLLNDNRIIFSKKSNGLPRKKYFRYEREQEGQCATNWWSDEQFGHNQEGNKILEVLMDGIKNTFSNPKPPRLLKNLLSIANCKDEDIVVDFFAGSGSFFQAALEYEHDTRIIVVQLKENLDDQNKEHKPSIEFCKKNNLPFFISELCKERIRRAGKKIKEENPDSDVDTGFRVLKIDSSNMTNVYYEPDKYKKDDLLDYVGSIKADRTGEDLLFQVMLDCGIDLSLPISKEMIEDKTVFSVGDNQLIACFDSAIDDGLVKQLAERRPLRVVLRDDGFISDAAKINVGQIFKLLSPETEVKSI